MKIKKWWCENYKSYGPGKTEIILSNGELILLKAPNGSGKCVHKKTFINVDICDLELNKELIIFLQETDTGRKIYNYIKNNNYILYEKIQKYKKENINKRN